MFWDKFDQTNEKDVDEYLELPFVPPINRYAFPSGEKMCACGCVLDWTDRYPMRCFAFVAINHVLIDIASFISSIVRVLMHYVDFYPLNMGPNLKKLSSIKENVSLLISLRGLLSTGNCVERWRDGEMLSLCWDVPFQSFWLGGV
jgi:hypothetical protein